jgi:hypothetical protein
MFVNPLFLAKEKNGLWKCIFYLSNIVIPNILYLLKYLILIKAMHSLYNTVIPQKAKKLKK